MADIEAIIKAAVNSRDEAKTRLVEKRTKLMKDLADVERDILDIDRAFAKAFGATVTGNGKRGRRSSASTQAELTHVKDAILTVLKTNKEWISTLALSKEVKDHVPGAADPIIARAKLELYDAKEIKRKGERRGAEYHA